MVERMERRMERAVMAEMLQPRGWVRTSQRSDQWGQMSGWEMGARRGRGWVLGVQDWVWRVGG